MKLKTNLPRFMVFVICNDVSKKVLTRFGILARKGRINEEI